MEGCRLLSKLLWLGDEAGGWGGRGRNNCKVGAGGGGAYWHRRLVRVSADFGPVLSYGVQKQGRGRLVGTVVSMAH